MNEGKKTWQVLVEAAAILAVNLASVWVILPPQERLWTRLHLSATARRLLGVLAVREGRAGMADELAGRDPAPRYVTAYRLSLLRDRAARLLEGMRP